MVVIEYNKNADQLEIHGTPEDLRLLADSLNCLSERPGDHDHLMTPSWSGDELGETPVGKDNQLINHVKVYCWATFPTR